MSEAKHELTIKLAPTKAGFSLIFRESKAVSDKEADQKQRISEETGTEVATLATALDVIGATAKSFSERVAANAEPGLFS